MENRRKLGRRPAGDFPTTGQFTSMAAFKGRPSFGFWKAGLLLGKASNRKLNDVGVTPVRKKAEPKEVLKPPPGVEWVWEGKSRHWKYQSC